MPWSVWRIPRSAVATLSSLVVAAVLGGGSPPAQAADPPGEDQELVGGASEGFQASKTRPFADRFPNVVLKTHEGMNVRFYDDLLKDKIVMINFFYVTCEER